jgi:hypothetical protein
MTRTYTIWKQKNCTQIYRERDTVPEPI